MIHTDTIDDLARDPAAPAAEHKMAPSSGPPDMSALGSPAEYAVQTANAFDRFMQTFEAFKGANDRRLKELEGRLGDDPITRDKVDRLNDALTEQQRMIDRLSLKHHRPGLGTDALREGGRSVHTKAFDTFMRTGTGLDGGMVDLARKARTLKVGTDVDGSYLAPDETARAISSRLHDISAIRSIASVRQISSYAYRVPFAISGVRTGWVGETADRPETDVADIRERRYPTMELYAMPAATQTLLDDALVDLDAWIADEVASAFAEQENNAFFYGDGHSRPQGILNVGITEESKQSWGNLGYLMTGKSGDFLATAPGDSLIDLVYSLKAGYRQNAHFVMNRKTLGAIRKIKDKNGDYLWRPPAVAGERATLLNFPVVEAEDMPDIKANSYAVVFGDFSRGYLIVDRLGVRVLRDPYSHKPYVLFYVTKRVGGGVLDYHAIKLLKFGTT